MLPQPMLFAALLPLLLANPTAALSAASVCAIAMLVIAGWMATGSLCYRSPYGESECFARAQAATCQRLLEQSLSAAALAQQCYSRLLSLSISSSACILMPRAIVVATCSPVLGLKRPLAWQARKRGLPAPAASAAKPPSLPSPVSLPLGLGTAGMPRALTKPSLAA